MIFNKKNNKKRLCLIGSLFLFVISLPTFSALSDLTEEDLPNPCKGTGCSLVATEVPWPKPLEGDLQRFTLRPINFMIPKNAHIDIILPAGVVAINMDGGSLYINIGTQQDFERDLEGIFKEIPFTMIDHPRLLFTMTPDDTEPEKLYDRWFWRNALWSKGDFFEDTKNAYITKKAPITIYYAETKSSGNDYVVFITHDKYPKRFVLMYGKGMSFKQLENIIAGIH